MASVEEATEKKATSEADVISTGKIPKELPQGAPWNTIEEAFLKRRSVRKYKKKQVPEHYVKRILEVARYAPSQGNCQPWRFIVIRDREMIDEMEAYVGAVMQMIGSAPPDPDTPEMHPVPRKLIAESPPDGTIGAFHNAPTLIIPAMDKRGIGHPEIDLGIVGTNIVMAAYSLGLASCWIGFAEFLNTGDWPERLGIKDPYTLIEAIAIGYPAGDPQRNFVNRETHKTTWFENGETREIY